MQEEFVIKSRAREPKDQYIPRWMLPKSKEAYPSPFFDNYSMLDHWERRKTGKGEYEYISQPYGLSFNTIKEMVKIADEHGIEFRIDGDSDHYPGRTVMIRWRQKPVREDTW